MILPPQHRFKLQSILSSVSSYLSRLVIANVLPFYSFTKTILKTQAMAHPRKDQIPGSISLAKQVLCCEKRMSKERNAQRIIVPK